MKLILTRHAKSSWETDHRDHDRPLSSRGIKAAGKIGRWLDAKGYHPRIVLCSTAARTRLTWSYLSEHLPPPAQVRFISAMYGGMPGSMLGNLQEEADDPVIMIGHNPGLASFASNILAQRPESPDFFRFPTGATLVCELDITSWKDCHFGMAKLVDFVVPRRL